MLSPETEVAPVSTNFGIDSLQAVEGDNQALKSELAQTKDRVEELAQMVRDVLAKLPVA